MGTIEVALEPVRGPGWLGSTGWTDVVGLDEVSFEALVWEGVAAAEVASRDEEPVLAAEPDEPPFVAGALDVAAEDAFKLAS